MTSKERIPQIGFWECFCCWHDLSCIGHQEIVQQIINDREWHHWRVWETEQQAIEELLSEEKSSRCRSEDDILAMEERLAQIKET